MTAAAESFRVALVGAPNCGKTALFNALTGSRQKVANYAGVTVERKEGALTTPDGRSVNVLDLPGTYSLRARSPDEVITRDAVLGRLDGEVEPDAIVCVADSTSLRVVLRLLLELKSVGRPIVLALNMYDIAERQGIAIDLPRLSSMLGVPIVTTVATRKRGLDHLLGQVDEVLQHESPPPHAPPWSEPSAADVRALYRETERILKACVGPPRHPDTWTGRFDRVLLHPVWGLLILFVVLFTAVPGGELGEAAAGPDDAGFTRLGFGADYSPHGRRLAAVPDYRRDHLRRRLRDRLRAADHDPVPVHHRAGRPGLYGPRGCS